MIPERNLPLNKISWQQRGHAINKLNDILNNGVKHFNSYTLNVSHYLTDYAGTIVEDIVLGSLLSKSTLFKCSVMNAVGLTNYFESISKKRLYIVAYCTT